VLGGALGSMLITIFRTSDSGASWYKVYANTPNTTSARKGAIPFGCDKDVRLHELHKGLHTVLLCRREAEPTSRSRLKRRIVVV